MRIRCVRFRRAAERRGLCEHERAVIDVIIRLDNEAIAQTILPFERSDGIHGEVGEDVDSLPRIVFWFVQRRSPQVFVRTLR